MKKNFINPNLRKVALATLLISVLGPATIFAAVNQDGVGLYRYPSQEKIDRQVDSVFRKLSRREKIAQIMVIDFTSMESKEKFAMQKRLVKKEKIGGVIPLGFDQFIPAVKKLNELNSLAKIPMLVTLDAEWGVSMRWDGIPAFQRFQQMGALSSDSLIYEVGKSIARECRALKIQVNYSPVVDINNNPEKHIVNTRSFHEDKEKVAGFSVAMFRGMRDGGVAGSAKHFPGHGDTDVDSHLALPILNFDQERIDSMELYPFKRLIAEGVDMVMVGHLGIPSLDPSGTPSSISRPIVTGLLREKLGYDGIICTDALNMYGVSKDSGLEKKEIPLAAFKAGVDLLLMPEDVENSIDVIEQALKRGEITMEELDAKVKKMLALKARLGILEKGYDPIVDLRGLERFTDTHNPDKEMRTKLHLINTISKETITVLFNDNSAGYGLPVSLEGRRVAYVGYKNPRLGHEFGELANRYGQVDTIILGNGASLEDLKQARNKLSNHDLIIMGFNETDQRAYKDYGIVKEEMAYITGWAAEQPMIAVYLGSPYAVSLIPDHKNFAAYVIGYMNTRPNNFAAAQVVFGGIPAKGVMPVSAASFKAGESIIIPDRYREEYFHLVGSREDSLLQVKFDMGDASPFLSVVPQVAELVSGGKVRECDTLGELLDVEGNDAALTVGELFVPSAGGRHVSYMNSLLAKYMPGLSAEEFVRKVTGMLGMRNTSFNGSFVTTTRGDLAKLLFAAMNGGFYEGRKVFNPYTAEVLLRIKDRYLK